MKKTLCILITLFVCVSFQICTEVNTATRKYAVTSKVTLLLIGGYSKIGQGLRELNLGEITVIDAEGKQVKK